MSQTFLGQRIRPDITPYDHDSAVTAATFSVQKILQFATEVKNSVYHRHIWSFDRPLSNIPDRITGGILPANPPIYYPRLFKFPKYTNADDRYNAQAKFWRSYFHAISMYPAPTSQVPLPITSLLHRKPENFVVDFLTEGVDQDVRDSEARSLRSISRGYPEPSKLQAEQLKHIQLLQSAIHHLEIAVIREDLAQQMFIYNTVNSLAKSMRILSQFGYQMRAHAYYGP